MDFDYSFGIPARNEEKTIIQTLESVINQTIPPKEIFVCVNGSKDKTYEKVRDMSIVENKINLISSASGKANAWNKIYSECSRDKIIFCDGDVIINSSAAENICNEFDKDSNLVLVGGSNAYSTSDKNTFFSKYFTENLKGNPIKQEWVCGRLYGVKTKELSNLARKLNVSLMPKDIIAEDTYLGILTKDNKKIIDSAYNLSMHVSTFNEWRLTFERGLAGKKQLKRIFTGHSGNQTFSIKRLSNYVERFNKISCWKNKLGVSSLVFLKSYLNLYHNIFNKLDYNPLWKETTSTKKKICLGVKG
jgi:glycosyltransferase involved in cell wall biosynthesis